MERDALEYLPSLLDEARKPQLMPVAKDAVLITPQGVKVDSVKRYLDEYKQTPDFIKQNVRVIDILSFCELVNRNKTPDTVIFASRVSTSRSSINFSVAAIMDYHPAGADTTKAGGKHNRVAFNAEVHKRMERWLAIDGQYMSQSDFAEFIEDNLQDLSMFPQDIQLPFGASSTTPAEMLTLSRGLEIHQNRTITNKTRLHNGETELNFKVENSRLDNAPVIVPEWFGLAVPILYGMATMFQPVRLRYRVREEKLEFSINLFNFDAILEEQAERIIGIVVDNVKDVPIFEGCVDAA